MSRPSLRSSPLTGCFWPRGVGAGQKRLIKSVYETRVTSPERVLCFS